MSEAELRELGARAIRRLQECGFWLTTAESCTGGLIAHGVTSVSGASGAFLGGVVAYANEVKMELLGVQAETLKEYGAVSAQTAVEMARGARLALKAVMNPERIIGISVTGIAGPLGGSEAKPVGLTWIGLSANEFEHAWRYHWQGDRAENIASSAEAALIRLLEFLDGKGSP